MSLKHRSSELGTSIGLVVSRAAADEYSDLFLTLCLCMKMAGPTRTNVRTCASELKKCPTAWHSHKGLNAILPSWDPAGYVLGLRREASDNACVTSDSVGVLVRGEYAAD